MATKMVSTGIQFPDNTVQTTAAGGSSGGMDFTASGAISAGDPVAIRSDGKVESVTGQVCGFTFGAENTIDTGTNSWNIHWSCFDVAYDCVSGKILVVYNNCGTNAKIVVGTPSGTSISWGTPVTFSTNNSLIYYRVSVNSTVGNRFMISYGKYSNNHNQLHARAGVISGNSVTLYTECLLDGYMIGEPTKLIYNSRFCTYNIAYARLNYYNYPYFHAWCEDHSNGNITLLNSSLIDSCCSCNLTMTYLENCCTFLLTHWKKRQCSVTELNRPNTATTANWGYCYFYSCSCRTCNTQMGMDYDSDSCVAIQFWTATSDITKRYAATSFTSNSNTSPPPVASNQLGGLSPHYYNNPQDQTALHPNQTLTSGCEGWSVLSGGITATYSPIVKKTIVAWGGYCSSNYATSQGVWFSTVSTDCLRVNWSNIEMSCLSLTNCCSDNDCNQKRRIVADTKNGEHFWIGTHYHCLIWRHLGIEGDYTNAKNYIGVANEAISNGSSGLINMVDAIDSNQSGLSVNCNYYLNYDGNMTTMDNGYAKIGSAVSSSTLVLQRS